MQQEMPAVMTQRRAFEELKLLNTGLNDKTLQRAIKAMPVFPDGKREKVHRKDVMALVNKINEWRATVPRTGHLRGRTKARIRAGVLG